MTRFCADFGAVREIICCFRDEPLLWSSLVDQRKISRTWQLENEGGIFVFLSFIGIHIFLGRGAFCVFLAFASLLLLF